MWPSTAASPRPRRRWPRWAGWTLLLSGGTALLLCLRYARDALAADARFEEYKARELQYWDEWVREKGFEYWTRMSNRELEDEIKHLIPSTFLRHRETIRVLDAGAGPVTQLGSVWPGQDLELHACDVLADQYATLLSKHDLDPPVRTVAADVEELHRAYPRQHFHLVLANNVLDKTKDPQRALRSILAALKPRGTLLIVHDASTVGSTRRNNLDALWRMRVVDGYPLLAHGSKAVNITAYGNRRGAAVKVARKGHTMFIRVIKVV